jgi:hypothetical protein
MEWTVDNIQTEATDSDLCLAAWCSDCLNDGPEDEACLAMIWNEVDRRGGLSALDAKVIAARDAAKKGGENQ